MKTIIPLLIAASIFSACEQRVETPASEKVVEKNTVVAPAAKTEEKSTTTTTH